jgi:hypothetical protein
LPLKKLVAFLFLVVSLILSSFLPAEEINIYFKTSPPPEQLRPFADPATVTLLVTAADGKPVAEGWVEVRLEAPVPGRFFSTDFPAVEGNRLTEMRLPLRRGKTEWKYLFPIRGEYRVVVDVVTADGKATKTFPLRISENREKWYFLGIFTLGLFALGVVAGRIFARPLPVAKAGVAISLFLLIVCLVAADAVSGQEAGKEKFFGWLEIDPATAGKPTRLRWRLEGDASAERPIAQLMLTITHLEKQKTMFSIERLPVAGEFLMNFHFVDGADYRVTALADIPGRGSVRTERYLSASSEEPPKRALIPALGLFIAAVATGLGIGRWSRCAAPS